MIQTMTPAHFPAVTALWQEAFGDPSELIGSFLERLSYDVRGWVLQADGVMASMAFAVSTKIEFGTATAPLWYVYALATRRAFRGQGRMTELLSAVRAEAQGNVPYLALCPAEETLVPFYRKRGYVPYFSARFVTVSRAELENAPFADAPCQSVGSVRWSPDAIARAIAFAKLGGDCVYSAADGRMIWRENGEEAEVTEWDASPGYASSLMQALLARSQRRAFRFRLPVYSPLFPGRGTVLPTGMMCSTTGEPLPTGDGAYLGLELS